MGFNKLQDILAFIAERNPSLKKRLHEAKALVQWEEAVGPQIAKHSRAVRVKDEVLWVEVDHSIWKSELHHKRHQILERLNAKSNQTPVKDLFFIEKRL